MIYLFSSVPHTIERFFKEQNIEYKLVPKELFAEFVVNIPEFGTKDFGISYDYGKIFPEKLLEKLKIVNIHFSLLPKYRGAVPVEAALLNNDSTIGVCLMWTDKTMDTGNILLKKEYPIPDKITASELQALLDADVPSLLQKLFIEGDVTTRKGEPQLSGATYCYKSLLKRENAEIDFTKITAKEVVSRVLAFNPDPYAWCKVKFQDQETVMNILRAEEYVFPGSVVSASVPKTITWVKKQGMVIDTLQGSVLVTEMVISGKKAVKNGEIVSLKGKVELA